MLLSMDNTARLQHNAVRTSVGWYEYTHRLLEIEGEDAAKFLDLLFVNSIGKAAVGRAKYTVMVNEEGKILDDVVIFRMDENKYWLSTLYIRDSIQWLDAHKAGYNVSYRDITNDWVMYSVQGPRAKELTNAVLDRSIDELKFFAIADNSVGGIPVKVARSGYTGEKWGYEIYLESQNSALLEANLEEKGKAYDAVHVTEIDVMCMTLACEKGLVLLVDLRELNPFEAGCDKYIDWNKDFIGKTALEKIKDSEVTRKLLGFTVDNDKAVIFGGPLCGEHGAHVFHNGKDVGRVTKFTYGFTVGKNIGYAVVDAREVKIGDHVTIHGNDAILTERGILK